MRRLFLGLLLGTLLIITGCTNSETTNNTTTVAPLVVGMECSYAPFNWTITEVSDTSVAIDGTSTYCEGYDVKIAQTIADELDRPLVIKAISWDGLIPALTANQIEAIIAGMSPTSLRKQTIAFSDEYFRSEQVVVVKTDSEYASATKITDFQDADITAQMGTLQENLISQMTGANVAIALEDYPTLVTAVNSSAVNGFIAELPVATQIVNNNSALTIVQFSEANGFVVEDADVTVGIGLRKSDSELLAGINEALAGITAETRTTWMNQYINLSSE